MSEKSIQLFTTNVMLMAAKNHSCLFIRFIDIMQHITVKKMEEIKLKGKRHHQLLESMLENKKERKIEKLIKKCVQNVGYTLFIWNLILKDTTKPNLKISNVSYALINS